MAREYSRVKVTIWADADFRSLTPRAQHLYFMLLTNPSLSMAGTAIVLYGGGIVSFHKKDLPL